MNNKEKTLKGKDVKESASLLTCSYLVLVGNGPDVGIVTFFLHTELNGATFSTSWFFESLPKVLRLLYLRPTRPTQPIKACNKIMQ